MSAARVLPERLVANVSLLFTEVPYLQRFAAARAAGFTAVETWWPFPTAFPRPAELAAFGAAIETAGVRLTGLNLYGGDLDAGERGVLSHPDRAEQFRSSLALAGQLAARTGCRLFNVLYGQHRPGYSAAAQRQTALDNLRAAKAELGRHGGTALLEPLTVGENGEYPLTTCADVAAIAAAARGGPGTLGLLLDTYHLANNGEDLPAAIDRYGDLIAHVQFADTPGRHEPGTGRIDFGAVLAALQRRGYRGRIAAEYRPLGRTADGLGWVGRRTLDSPLWTWSG